MAPLTCFSPCAMPTCEGCPDMHTVGRAFQPGGRPSNEPPDVTCPWDDESESDCPRCECQEAS